MDWSCMCLWLCSSTPHSSGVAVINVVYSCYSDGPNCSEIQHVPDSKTQGLYTLPFVPRDYFFPLCCRCVAHLQDCSQIKWPHQAAPGQHCDPGRTEPGGWLDLGFCSRFLNLCCKLNRSSPPPPLDPSPQRTDSRSGQMSSSQSLSKDQHNLKPLSPNGVGGQSRRHLSPVSVWHMTGNWCFALMPQSPAEHAGRNPRSCLRLQSPVGLCMLSPDCSLGPQNPDWTWRAQRSHCGLRLRSLTFDGETGPGLALWSLPLSEAGSAEAQSHHPSPGDQEPTPCLSWSLQQRTQMIDKQPKITINKLE